MKTNYQKGTSILLTILIMAALLAITVGVSRLSLGELKLTQDIPETLIAYYAADAGIEKAIYQDRKGDWGVPGVANFEIKECLDSPTNEICYDVGIEGSVENDPVDRRISSTGSYKNTERAIELSF